MYYTRITHNTLGYQKPSGVHGKSSNNKTFEGLHGFGWEEWLFNKKFLLDEYHYGFIQGASRTRHQIMSDLYLFSYNNKWTYAGKIKHLEVLSEQQVKHIKTQYLKNGWWDEMKKDLNTAQNTIADCLFKCDFRNIVNVRFKPKDLIKATTPIDCSEKLNTRYGIYKVNPKLETFLTNHKLTP